MRVVIAISLLLLVPASAYGFQLGNKSPADLVLGESNVLVIPPSTYRLLEPAARGDRGSSSDIREDDDAKIAERIKRIIFGHADEEKKANSSNEDASSSTGDYANMPDKALSNSEELDTPSEYGAAGATGATEATEAVPDKLSATVSPSGSSE